MAVREISYVSSNSLSTIKPSESMEMNSTTQPPTSCSCHARTPTPPRMTSCARRWATVIVSALVLMTFLTVALVTFVVLNSHGKPSPSDFRQIIPRIKTSSSTLSVDDGRTNSSSITILPTSRDIQ